MTVAAVAGGLAGLVVVALLDPDRQFLQAESVAMLVGALGGVALHRLFRR